MDEITLTVMGRRLKNGSETLLHYVAKHAIAEAIKRSIETKDTPPTIVMRCQTCGCWYGKPARRVDRWDRVLIEEPIGPSCVPDVTVVGIDGPRFAVEILHRSAVDADKAERMPCPYVELFATDVIVNGPLLWRPVTGRPRAMWLEAKCADCAKESWTCWRLVKPPASRTKTWDQVVEKLPDVNPIKRLLELGAMALDNRKFPLVPLAERIFGAKAKRVDWIETETASRHSKEIELDP